jgi:thiol-disulfide isomerase/thioredoxin
MMVKTFVLYVALLLGVIAPSVNGESVVPLIKIGDIAPTFMLPSMDDKRISLRDYCGQLRQSWKNAKQHIVIVSFMASYCVPCRREIPLLEAFAKDAGDDVKVIYISVDTLDRSALMPFVKKMNIQQTVLLDRYGSIMKKYGVQKLPSLFILNHDGALCYQNLDGLPESVDLIDLLKKEVAAIRKAATVSEGTVPPPSKAPLTMHVKLNVMSSLFAGKSISDICNEVGVTADEIAVIKNEIDSVMRSKWGFKD